jgi:hypothetical protein
MSNPLSQKFTSKDLDELMALATETGISYILLKELFFKGNFWRGSVGFRMHLERLKNMESGHASLRVESKEYYDFLYVMPIDEMPLFVNEDGMRGVMSRWRLRCGK